ncbi:hypothetical protein HPULCUR_009750 [Helicostylum pulchrum]|uniref:SGF29 C-terminal domain-containing protein n=1 Tax=Helicostylum pulchrum TaxID=562976 RepID=A0ABP9YCG1_9FUNG
MDRKSRTSRSATLDDTNEEVSLWKQICNALAKLENIQKDTANIVTNINTIHTAVNFEEGVPPSIGTRLMDYYRGGIELSTSEAKTIHDIIEKVSVLVALRDASEYNNVIDQKRKKRRAEQDDASAPSQLSKKSKTTTTTNSNILPYGTSVAARQPKQKDKNEEWILAVVLGYHTEKNKYEVEDVDQDDFGQKQRYMLQPRNVIRIPDADEAKSHAELNPGQDILALYPGTTCFYRAKIVSTPTKNKDPTFIGNYKVQFEDDNNEVKYVMPRHVLEVPKIK